METMAASQLTRGREEYVIDLATFVAERHHRSGPIDPCSILDTLKILYTFGSYGEAFDGALEYRDGRFHVYCNLGRCGSPDTPRARFTLAHELGHYFIDEHRRALESGQVPAHGSYCGFVSNYRVEREADLFATSLLMPETQFREKASASSPGLATVRRLASEFRTSLTSTAIRFVKQDLIPCAVIRWSSQDYQWHWISDSMRQCGLMYPRDNFDSLPIDSASFMALRDIPSPEADGFHAVGGTASYWFGVREGSPRDRVLREEAISLGEFGALTLLYPIDQ